MQRSPVTPAESLTGGTAAAVPAPAAGLAAGDADGSASSDKRGIDEGFTVAIQAASVMMASTATLVARGKALTPIAARAG